jgi:hypothetical protein
MHATKSANPEATFQVSPVPMKGAERLVLTIVLLLHLGATCILLPPWEVLRREPLRYMDQAIHTHRIYMYRQGFLQSGWPWGYDPAVGAGAMVHPFQDIGAKPQQVLGLLLPFLSPGTVERLFVFVVALTFPLWTLLACRRLGIPVGAQVWVMVTLLVPAWLYDNLPLYFFWGLVAFTAASYFTPYVLVLFCNFLSRPGLKSYAAFCCAAALLFLLHVLGPVVLVPSLILYTLAARSLTWRWRTAALLAPVIIFVLNAFWFVPCMLDMGAPKIPWPPLPAQAVAPHFNYQNWSDLVMALTPLRVAVALCGLSLAAYGFVVLRRVVDQRVVVAFALAAAFGLFLKFFGSFLPVFVRMQPPRFLVPAFALLTLPVGTALFTLTKKARLPAGLSAAMPLLLIMAALLLLGKPNSLPLPPSPDPLADFVARRTAPTERLLIQTGVPHGPRVMALAFGREVIGNTFPKQYDPAQFLHKTVWGKELDNWSPGELRSALERWGVAWVFTKTDKAHTLFAKATNSPGEAVGTYQAFRVPGSPTRFLVGRGRVQARVNRLDLTELIPEDGLVVLKYRYHPAWQTTSGLPVYQYPIPEDPVGFIALRNPPEAVTLRFSPWAMLHAPWPQ